MSNRRGLSKDRISASSTFAWTPGRASGLNAGSAGRDQRNAGLGADTAAPVREGGDLRDSEGSQVHLQRPTPGPGPGARPRGPAPGRDQITDTT